MEEGRLNQQGNELQDEREPLLRPKPPMYLHFRQGRQPQLASRCYRFVLSVFKITFISLGLWGHQAWNYIPRFVLSATAIFQAVYWLSEDMGCPGFQCDFYRHFNLTPYKHERTIERTCYTIFSLGALLSYAVLIGCFNLAARKDSALLSPSESMMADIQRKDIFLLFLAFVFITMSAASSLTLYYMNSTNPSFFSVPVFKFEATAVAAQFVAHWASVHTCHVFAISSFALGTFAQDTLRLIRNVQNGTLDDVIRIHERLCTVVFDTVSAYSVWFVVHWFTYGAGVVVAVIYLSEEVVSSVKYRTPSMDLVFLGLIFVCLLYLFTLPCICAARITSSCAGIYEKINSTTSDDWNEGHPFKDRLNIFLFVSYAKDRHCGFKVGRITFNTSLTWISFFLGLTALLFHFFY